MRELFLVDSESSEDSLVLRTEEGEEFSLPITDELRSALTPAASKPEPPKLAPMPKPSHEEEEKQIRPAEIQNRIRAGASTAELAEEMHVDESRIEPFAYPVMLERNRISEVAKQAHPVREDGPAKLTLWEVLASSFAARGHSLSESTWDAYRHQGEPWVVRVTWKAGLSENEAEWTFKQSMSSPATVEARNSVAADLTDPDFVQPVRSLTSLGSGRYDEAIDGDQPANVTDISGPSEETEEEEFLQNPSSESKPSKRRRKAVTPHWEDVLLGVRSNTKRPRD
ncbi:septation protein SepH [Corynebacterium rhinophilum]|uniref:septation protein SepH n=1 Tax=Corynebacterium rhinophilum TaxID=3050197 RepID=UPI002550CCC4|nr:MULTISPECIES: septation protein SepH [unclassified Corynebacterium]MDK8467408.1 septation protein SepH [Corynebacterium sp. MSK130]MDK8491826.1 septation protein SepH [Corynebacterium sp. MSK175]MDK8688028.1 septation protein SepH [Corynebacterium sp. MSK122]